MGAPYTGDPTGAVVASYANPADGADRVNAASVTVAIRGLTDDVARLAVGKRSPRTWLGNFSAPCAGGSWLFDGALWLNNSLTDNGSCFLTLPLTPEILGDGLEIEAFSVRIRPFTAARAGLPGTMPRVRLSRMALATGAVTVIQSVNDGSASVPAYETYHAIDQNGIGEPVNHATHAYWLEFRSESGINTSTGLGVSAVTIQTVAP